MKGKPVFVILGAGGFPYKVSAAGNKYFLMAKALAAHNFDVILVSKYNISNDIIKEQGNIDEIKYFFLSGGKKRDTLFLKICGEIRADIKLIFFLKKLRTKSRKNYVMISYNPLYLVVFYWLLTKIYRFKLVFSLMEDHTILAKGLFKKVRAQLFWNFGFYFANGALPISIYLQNRIITKFKNISVFRVPVLADFSHEGFKARKVRAKYFLYCGDIGYYEVIELIINAFYKLSDNEIHLILILYGNQTKINNLQRNMLNNNRIHISRNIPQYELYKLYTNSIGLLIPMRPSRQDRARFPQKIAEYLASGRPIITNNIGEIQYYFNDGVNTIFAKDYSIEAYRDAMQIVLNYPDLCNEIGKNGRKMGYKYFHYESISEQFSEFLLSL